MRMSQLTDIVTGQKTVTTSGTPEVLIGSAIKTAAGVVAVIKAKNANTTKVTLGNSSASALNTGSSHFSLYPGESVTVQIGDLNRIYVDAETSGEGVEYIYER